MPAPYILQLTPVVGIESSTTSTPDEELVLTLTPVLKGDVGEGGGGGVSQEYVDNGDAATLVSANAYTDSSLSDKADLVGGFVPASQLPSFVDDVLEGHLIDMTTFDDLFNAPYVPESGKIYLDITTNLQYRWGGSSYVVLNPSLALGETPSTAYRGDRGKIAYDHSQTTGNPHGTTAAQITGLAIVATTGSYTDLSNKPVISAGNTFQQSRWNSYEFEGADTGGYRAAINYNGGSSNTVAAIDAASVLAGTSGVVRLSCGAQTTSGSFVGLGGAVLVGRTGLAYRSITRLVGSLPLRKVHEGLFVISLSAVPTNGVYFTTDNLTIVANTRKSTGTIISQGSYTAPAGTFLVKDIEYLSDTSVRFVVWDFITGAKYLDETIISQVPNLVTELLNSGITAHSGAGTTAAALIDIDYLGHGLKRPVEITVPT